MIRIMKVDYGYMNSSCKPEEYTKKYGNCLRPGWVDPLLVEVDKSDPRMADIDSKCPNLKVLEGAFTKPKERYKYLLCGKRGGPCLQLLSLKNF